MEESINSSASSSAVATSVEESAEAKVLILKLRNPKKPKVRWTQETINNEFMRKKSSKLCCIYHKAKKFGESDSDESDSDADNDRAGPTKESIRRNMQRFHA
jgi:protein phosphatase 1 regulatory subunit 11